MNEYPSEEVLDTIEIWLPDDIDGWFDYIRQNWWMGNDLINDRGMEIEMSTGGWSGNEDIIEAMHRNAVMWNLCWVQSRRGGHYIFQRYYLKLAVSNSTNACGND